MTLCAVAVFGCARTEKTHATIADRLPLVLGDANINVQVAVTQGEQVKGLMYRKQLPDGDGMIFVYKKPQEMAFWMNHVPIPISIGFIKADGTLDEVRLMLPNDIRSTVSSSKEIQYVLEMNKGWFERHNVRAGAKLDMELLEKALKARGEEPVKYGIKQ